VDVVIACIKSENVEPEILDLWHELVLQEIEPEDEEDEF
jgi:hypothetical protein